MRRTPAATPLSATMAKSPMSPVARDVRAAAQLHAEARDRHDADAVAVLLAEQRHRAGGDRVLRVLHVGLHRRVPQDLLVDDALDFERLFARDGAQVNEVEAQAIGRHERARLLDVTAEHLPERRVQQMSGRVVAAGRVAKAGDRRRQSRGRAVRASPRRDVHPVETRPRSRTHDRAARCASPRGPAIVPTSETCPPASR